MTVQIFSSNAKGNAPPGYLIARIELASGVYVESERNPYTYGEWRFLSFHLGDWNAPGSESLLLGSIDMSTHDVAREITDLLRQVSLMFESLKE